MNRKSGFTLIEFLIVYVIIGIFLTIFGISYKKLRSNLRINKSIRNVVSAFNYSKYYAIRSGRSVKVMREKNRINLYQKIRNKWKVFKNIDIDISGLTIHFNRFPVFSSIGTVAPLCSVYISDGIKKFKISISMAGRIKTAQVY